MNEHWPVIGQFSSIGSLGASSHTWLCAEWLLSLSMYKRNKETAASSSSSLHRYPNLKLVISSEIEAML